MKALGTAAALLVALLLQSALSLLFPEKAQLFDPFLLVLVYCGLMGGENHGMLAGVAAGWVQDVNFGGPVLGLMGLTKAVVGFAVGLASTRFLLNGPFPRFLLILSATLFDALLLERSAALFEIALPSLDLARLLLRGTINAAVGMALFDVADRRLRTDARP